MIGPTFLVHTVFSPGPMKVSGKTLVDFTRRWFMHTAVEELDQRSPEIYAQSQLWLYQMATLRKHWILKKFK